jgi:spore maturation protein CgeB
MKILLIGLFQYSTCEAAWARALRELGHEVIEISSYSSFSGLFGRFQNRFQLGPAIKAFNNKVIACASDNKPEVVLAYRSLSLLPATLISLRKILPSAMFVSYQNDNIFGALSNKSYWRHFKASIPYYDLQLVFRSSDEIRYMHLGAKRTYVLMHHFIPWLHKARTSTDSFIYDIGFYGHAEPDYRIDCIEALSRIGDYRIAIKGQYWKKYGSHLSSQIKMGEPIFDDFYAQHLRQTRICLGFTSTWNCDEYTTRHFEIPACGSMLLAPRTNVAMSLYREDREACFFDSHVDLAEKARYYLKNEEIRQSIADAGKMRAQLSGYDIYSRMKEWLAII